MEIQLQELIEHIKKDGVAAAEKEATAILDAAKNEAEKIVSDAKAEAKTLISQAKEENDRTVRVGEEALRQAGRNVLLSFRESIARELDAVVGDCVNAVCSSQCLSDLIIKTVLAWSNNPETDDIAVLLNSEDTKKLEGALLAAFKEHMLSGVVLKTDDSFDNGFRIAVNGGRAYYDYSAQAITEMMSAYLSPKVKALLKEADKV